VVDAKIGIADAYLMEGNANAAVIAYEAISAGYPQNRNGQSLFYRLAVAYKKIGQADKARSCMNKLMASAPLSFEVRMPQDPAGSTEKERYGAAKAPEDKRYHTDDAARTVFSIQIGSFKNKKNADRIRQKLTGQGYDCYIDPPGGDHDRFYRVKVGRFGSKEEASMLARKLKKKGYATKICTKESCE
jgi:cell division septation protein DedD